MAPMFWPFDRSAGLIRLYGPAGAICLSAAGREFVWASSML